MNRPKPSIVIAMSAAFVVTIAGQTPASLVSNGDFELPVFPEADQANPAVVPTDWSFSGTAQTNRANLRKAGPLTTAPVDNTHGNFWFQNNSAGNTNLLTQVTDEVIVEGAEYTLKFEIGEQNNGTSALGRAMLYGDSTGTASPFAVLNDIDGGATAVASNWTTVEIDFVATAGQAGENLSVGLGLDADHPTASGSNVSYDNISLVRKHISIDPATGVTSSSEIVGPDRKDDYVVDGNDLTDGQHTNDNGDGSMWLTTGSGFGGIDPDPWIEFDLGAIYEIDSFRVWNLNHDDGGIDNTDRGVKDLAIEYGTTAALGSTLAGVDQFAEATGDPNYTGQLFNGDDFTGLTTFTARYIRFSIDTNYGDTGGFTGLSEVQFYGTVVVPAPAALPAGLAMLGLIAARRRR